MTGQVEIRPITLADEAEWRRLWTLYLEFYESSVPEEVYQTTLASYRRSACRRRGVVLRATRHAGAG
jgi:hypothetical protein